MQEPNEPPWYKDPTHGSTPYKLARKITSQDPEAPDFCSLALFPWDTDSLQTLWNGAAYDPDKLQQWREIISEYWDAVAVGSKDSLYIVFTKQHKSPLSVKFPPTDLGIGQQMHPLSRMHVAWALSPNSYEPVVIFCKGAILCIYNVVRNGIAGYLRGHGAMITSIVAHPTTPHLFCSTSRDHTSRIYDLTQAPQVEQHDTVWPPSKRPSRAGAAHGLHMSGTEGSGIGRCIIVLMGGRSGGHQAAVLGAAFHPALPLIATCGMDRCVKIWVIRSSSPMLLGREEKPLFSTSRIHKAQVLSISWLHHDLLMTHSAPTIMQKYPGTTEKGTYLEPGELAVWRWLSLNRFFPPTYDRATPEQRADILKGIRGVSADYQETSSFKFVSLYTFPPAVTPYETCKVSLYQSLTHDPLVQIIFPESKSIRIANASHFKPCNAPVFPFTTPKKGMPDDPDAAADALADRSGLISLMDTFGRDSEVVPPLITGWEISCSDATTKLFACEIGRGGRELVAVGSKGTLHIWRYDD